MVAFVRIISENFNLKKPKKNKKNIFTIYSPKKATIEKADTLTIDTEFQSNYLKIQLHFSQQNLKDKKFKNLSVQTAPKKGCG